MNRKIAIFPTALIICICLFLNFGCSTLAYADQPGSAAKKLWVVTEETVADGMNAITKHLCEKFMENNPGVTIKLDVLPTEEDARTAYLDHLNDLTRNGQGPDVYLLPTSDVLTLEKPQTYTYQRVEPLFQDVELAMRHGKFKDISALYDADNTLEKSAFAPTIIDSGVVDGARYVIPLRYNIPVLYCRKSAISALNIEPEIFDASFDQWMNYVIEQGDAQLVYGAEYPSMNVFHEILDYKKGEVVLSSELVAAYFSFFQEIEARIGTEIAHRSATSIDGYILGTEKNFPAKVGKLNQAMDYAAIAAAENDEIMMYPIKAINGDVIATVTYYAAVDSQSKNVELAYDFIRQFLSEDAQLDTIRSESSSNPSYGMIEQSWPVRTAGSVLPLWKHYKQRIDTLITGAEDDSVTKRHQAISKINLQDKDIPMLTVDIDQVRFSNPVMHEFDAVLRSLNNPENGQAIGTLNKQEVAKQFVDVLKEKYASIDKSLQ